MKNKEIKKFYQGKQQISFEDFEILSQSIIKVFFLSKEKKREEKLRGLNNCCKKLRK